MHETADEEENAKQWMEVFRNSLCRCHATRKEEYMRTEKRSQSWECSNREIIHRRGRKNIHTTLNYLWTEEKWERKCAGRTHRLLQWHRWQGSNSSQHQGATICKMQGNTPNPQTRKSRAAHFLKCLEISIWCKSEDTNMQTRWGRLLVFWP